MQIRSVARVLFSLTLSTVSMPAQQTTTATPIRDPAAVALLAKSLAVMTSGQPISDVTLQGTARRIAGSDDETGTAVLKALATGEARIDLSLSSGSRSEVRATSADGPGGAWSGPDGAKHPIAQHNLWTDSSWFFPALALARAISSPDYNLTYVGQEKRDGRAVEHVTAYREFSSLPPQTGALLQHLSQMELYLDSSTLLPVALSFNIHPDGDAGLDIPVEVRLSDYRLVNGSQVPFRVQKYLNNGLILDLQFQTASLNSGLAASAFQL